MLRRACSRAATASTLTPCTAVAGPSSRAVLTVRSPASATRRAFHVSSAVRLPRTPPTAARLARRPEHDEDGIETETEAVASSSPDADGDIPTAANDGVPWFLQQDVIEVDPLPGHEDASGQSRSSRQQDDNEDDSAASVISPSAAETAASTPLPADLPNTLRLLHQHLTAGPLAGLLYKPAFDDAEHGITYEAIEFVDARSTGEVISWCDWVVFVTVRENTGGNVNARVAEDVGDILKRAGPPTAEELESYKDDTEGDNASVELDDLLGPSKTLSGATNPYGPQSRVRWDEEQVAKAQTRLERAEARRLEYEQLQAERERDTPAWRQHRQAIKAKLQDSNQSTSKWSPLKILSRETQHGLRILHRSDPEKWTTPVLAAHFKVSPESIRRILKARPEKWGGDGMEDKGYRRISAETGERLIRVGPERWVREEEEIERLRAKISGQEEAPGADALEDGIPSDLPDPDADANADAGDAAEIPIPSRRHQTPLFNLRSLGKPRHPVRFEGLPASSSANKSRNKRIAKRAAFGGGTVGDNAEGDTAGEWVLVDAGWCVVHIMTPQSRERYRIEDVWKKPADQGGFEDLDII